MKALEARILESHKWQFEETSRIATELGGASKTLDARVLSLERRRTNDNIHALLDALESRVAESPSHLLTSRIVALEASDVLHQDSAQSSDLKHQISRLESLDAIVSKLYSKMQSWSDEVNLRLETLDQCLAKKGYQFIEKICDNVRADVTIRTTKDVLETLEPKFGSLIK